MSVVQFVPPPLPAQASAVLDGMNTADMKLADIMTQLGASLTQQAVAWTAFDSNQIAALLKQLGKTWLPD